MKKLLAIFIGFAIMAFAGCSHTAVIVIEKKFPQHDWTSKVEYRVHHEE